MRQKEIAKIFQPTAITVYVNENELISIINPLVCMHERVTVVVWCIIPSFIHSVTCPTVPGAVLASTPQPRYEQDKRVNGLHSDSWILLKCLSFSSV